MKIRTKRILSTVSALTLIGTAVPSQAVSQAIKKSVLVASAETSQSDFEFDAKTGTITNYIGNAEVLEIPSEIDGVAVKTIDCSAFSYTKTLKEVTIPEGVEKVDCMAFAYCSNLQKITLPDTLKTIGHYAFLDCACAEITIPDSVTSMGEGVFAYCTNLYTAILSESLKEIPESCFSNCDELFYINIPDGIERIDGAAFFKCKELEKVTLPLSLKEIGDNAFDLCDALRLVEYVGNADDFAKVKTDSCNHKLTDASWDYNFVQEKLSDIKDFGEYTFNPAIGRIDRYNGNDEVIEIPKEIGGAAVKSIGQLSFCYNETVKEIIVPDGVESIGFEAFQRCPALESIKLPDSIKKIDEFAFLSCTSLKSITIPSGVTAITKGDFFGCSALKEVVLSENLESIGELAFNECTSLEEIAIPDTVTFMDIHAFNKCTSLRNATLPKGIKRLEHRVFYGCSSLEEIVLPEGLEEIGITTFGDCKKLKKITFSDSLKVIESEAFEGTQWLKDRAAENPLVIVNGILCDGKSCKGDVVIPDTVTRICTDAFYDANDIETISIPRTVKTIEYPEHAFAACQNLKTIYFGGTKAEWEKIVAEQEDKINVTVICSDSVKSLPKAAAEMKGDVNCDGEVNIADLALIKGWLLNSEKYSVSEQGMKNADLYGNDGINSTDVVLLQKMILNIED